MVDSVWLREERRGTAPLTRERIVAEAVALLDAEGAGRLTMRRLAERLGTGSTTLYWHVDTKHDVVDLALDAIFGEVALPPSTGDWRAEVTALLRGWRSAMLRHPWSAEVLGRPLLGPNVLARTEFLHAALVRAGFVGADLVAAAYALSNHVIGSALMQAGSGAAEEAAERSAADELLARRREEYPTLASRGHPSGNDWDDAFDRGLGFLLDGMAGNARP
ncbi:TetR/AcrR family transcriptional regulator [Actinomadura sp. WMMB 499]|uniref:TetR/AcrR family transcriptional regulator n=1 Tax=Actinomadura sp. WMMB 499 TaxID=1219491 RepID=UPI001248B902|nr:TetR/AcrR family transcriptional regulator [Actinomadura sp. WMMB 499]QFG26404.1 TetR/AcrR family transcriptional regulator [Actinomadura sp. WMMB 499]